MKTEFKIVDPYENELHTYLWESEASEVHGIVMLLHGASEHCGRYDHFAEYLNSKGFHVIGCDYLGHGKTSDDLEKIYFAPTIGFHKVYEGVKTIRDYIDENYPKMPVIMFAHAMGSFFGRYAMLYDQKRYDMAIFSGTGLYNPLSLMFQRLIVSILIKLKGDTHVSEWFNENIADGHIRDMRKSGIINKSVEWRSQVPQILREFNEDELCGQPFTLGAQRDLLSFLPEIQDKKRIKDTASSAGIFFISGDLDPLGKYGADIKKLYDMYQECGYSNVKYMVLNNTRHEIVFDIEKEHHYLIMYDWIMRNLR